MRAATIALTVSLAPGLVAACEIATYEDGYVVPPATFGADCSFNVPGAVTYYTDTFGTAAVNIGGGRIGQRVSKGFGCGSDEEVWIVDCNSGEMIGINGPQAPDDMNLSRRADLLYPSHGGALRLSPETTVADITAIAQGAGYTTWTDFTERLGQISGQTPPDPACGCRIFYPDSALATQ
jgi:hypothetical protein